MFKHRMFLVFSDVSQKYSQTNILEKLKYSQYILKKIIPREILFLLNIFLLTKIKK